MCHPVETKVVFSVIFLPCIWAWPGLEIEPLTLEGFFYIYISGSSMAQRGLTEESLEHFCCFRAHCALWTITPEVSWPIPSPPEAAKRTARGWGSPHTRGFCGSAWSPPLLAKCLDPDLSGDLVQCGVQVVCPRFYKNRTVEIVVFISRWSKFVHLFFYQRYMYPEVQFFMLTCNPSL